MGKYNFDEVIDRHGTDCLKYDFGMKRKGRDDLLPLWVADMDFRLPDEILDEFHKRIDHGIFGYTDPLDEYFAAMNHWFSTRYADDFIIVRHQLWAAEDNRFDSRVFGTEFYVILENVDSL